MDMILEWSDYGVTSWECDLTTHAKFLGWFLLKALFEGTSAVYARS